METEVFSEAEIKQMISEVRKQTHASFELLNGLFEWGKAQLQGIQVNQKHFETHPVIQKNISLLSQQASLKKIIITDHSPVDARLFADPNQFDFIIRNLLSNAIKFTFPSGFIDIYASKNNDEMIYSVRDTGIGITTKQQQLFLKTNMTVAFGTTGEKGSGLGLLLIREFMKANKGRIWLESEEGKGTTFYFSFPLK
jgi:signal transduction histidine kinase